MHRPLVLAVSAVAFPVLVLSGVGHAGGTPGQACAGAKLKATAKAAGARVACHARATQEGAVADPGCLDRAATKLIDAFARAEARGGCATMALSDEILALVDSGVGAFVAALRSVASSNPNRCAAAELEAEGKKAKTKLGCHAKATGRGLTVDQACLTKAEASFVAAFAKAEARSPCLTTSDAASIESLVDDLVDEVVAALPATATTTTTTTMPSLCGNGVIDPGEECDGQAVCSASCHLNVSACCQLTYSDGATTCADMFPLDSYLYHNCYLLGGSSSFGTCDAIAPCAEPYGCGTCGVHAIPPTPVCCQGSGSCTASVAETDASLTAAWHACVYTGGGLGAVVVGTCGADGVCIPGGS